MAQPTAFRQTPRASTTSAVGYALDASQEVWQKLTGTSLFVVYEGVPVDLAKNLLESRDVEIDAVIRLQLAAYPKRISS
jgi:hypothetical protein